MIISSLDQISTEWLTAVLSSSGALIDGTVAFYELVAGRGNWSSNAILKIQYEKGSKGSLPRSVFLKMVDAGASSSDEFFGESEVTYYTQDYLDVGDAPLVHCYDAAFSIDQHRYHLLLDDMSETHVEAVDKVPTLEYGLALAEGLAAMHARWWGAERLAEAGAPIHSAEYIRRFVKIAEPGAGHIIMHFTDELKPHWPDAIRAIYAKHPAAIIERTNDPRGFTLVHGDVGEKNVLVPRDRDRPIYIIDRQPFNWSLTTWLGAYDLAYAMVLDWEVETRRRLEIPVLRRYHTKLLEKGVEEYSWNQLFDDYRLCVAMGVYIATEYCRGGVNKRWISVYLSMLKRSLAACDDLDCQELW